MIYPKAKYEYVKGIDLGILPFPDYRAVILHTNGGGPVEDLYGWWQSGAAGGGIGAQYQVALDGSVYQYIDDSHLCYHAYGASRWAVGCETGDFGRASDSWTPQQVDAIVALLVYKKVPAKLLLEGPSEGIGWHRQYASWNQSGHACPTDPRIQQIKDEIIPKVKAGGDSMTDAEVLAAAARAAGFGADVQGFTLALQAAKGLRSWAHGDAEPKDADVKLIFDKLRQTGGSVSGAKVTGTFTGTVGS